MNKGVGSKEAEAYYRRKPHSPSYPSRDCGASSYSKTSTLSASYCWLLLGKGLAAHCPATYPSLGKLTAWWAWQESGFAPANRGSPGH